MVNLTVSGVVFPYPEVSDTAWGEEATAWATAVSASALFKAGGAFTLTSEVDFGAVAGLKSLYYKSRTSNPAAAGQVRLARADTVRWRNQANSADLELGVNASNQLTFGGTALGFSAQPTFSDTSTIDLTLNVNDVTADVIAGSLTNTHINAAAAIDYSKLNLVGSVVNADVNAAAAIAYSKLSLAGSIVDADVNASAAIAYSKLSLADSIVNADVNAAAAIAYSKLNLAGSIVNADVSNSAAIAYSKLNLAGSVVDADVAAGAAIAHTKMAALTASRVPVLDANGFMTASSVTATTLGFLDATSSIQTQLNALVPGLALLQTYSPSSAASVDVTSQITGTYDAYLVIFSLRPANDGQDLKMRTDTSNGASFDSGASDYSFRNVVQTSTTTVSGAGGDSDSQMWLTPSSATIGNATNEGVAGYILIPFLGSVSFYPQFQWGCSYMTGSTVHVHNTGSGTRKSAAAINAIQLFFTTGNIASGTVRIYGIKTS